MKTLKAGRTSALVFLAVDIICCCVFMIILVIYKLLRSFAIVEPWKFENSFPGLGLGGLIGLFPLRQAISCSLIRALAKMEEIWSFYIFRGLLVPWNIFLVMINTFMLYAILLGWARGITNVDTAMEIALFMFLLISEFGYLSLFVQMGVAHEEMMSNDDLDILMTE